LPARGTSGAARRLAAAGNWSASMHIIYVIIIGFFAGLIAKFLLPGPNNPGGFILTTILGIVGAIVANFLGKEIGWYQQDQPLSFVSAIVGAVIVLAIYRFVSQRNVASF
jgi:uncharacterized membrane protein YeaQ/YmgE (transglycosylase-associated protein family)